MKNHAASTETYCETCNNNAVWSRPDEYRCMHELIMNIETQLINSLWLHMFPKVQIHATNHNVQISCSFYTGFTWKYRIQGQTIPGLLSIQQKDLMKMMKMNSYEEWKQKVHSAEMSESILTTPLLKCYTNPITTGCHDHSLFNTEITVGWVPLLSTMMIQAVSNILAGMLKLRLDAIPALLQLSALAPSAHRAMEQSERRGVWSDMAIIHPGTQLWSEDRQHFVKNWGKFTVLNRTPCDDAADEHISFYIIYGWTKYLNGILQLMKWVA